MTLTSVLMILTGVITTQIAEILLVAINADVVLGSKVMVTIVLTRMNVFQDITSVHNILNVQT